MTLTARPLGQTGLSLSPLTLGTVKFGRNQSVKYPGGFDLPTDNAILELLAQAQEAGMTSLDTAPAYGLAEQRLGQLLKGQRQQWQIITKAGESYDSRNDCSLYDYSPAALKRALENSLRLLNTDYLDCWMVHSDGNDIANLNDDVINTLHKARDEGWVRSIGMSTKTVEGGEHALNYLDTIMMTASLSHSEEMALFDIAQAKGKGLLLKKIYDSGWALEQKDSDKKQTMQDTLAALFKHPSATSAVIGTINPKHLQENIAAFNAIAKQL